MLIVAAGAVAGVASGMAWAVRGRSSRIFGPSVWRGPRDQRRIALTFDDGPSESTPQILRVLAEHRAHATFFQCGANVDRLPGVAREVAAAGHELGNHTYSHERLYLQSASFIEGEVARGQEAIERATGYRPRLFRPPFGVRWFGLAPALQRQGLLGVMWTAIGSDWRLPTTGVVRKLLRTSSNGAILCLHDGRGRRPRPDASVTVEAVRRLLPALRDRGYQFHTVSDLLCPMN
ncbi:MAG TPA: polysaccharide deacetylase family protein [Bryobacteraceae bacterium]|nr:polysaccharide deacetylase family protein [Bryobacteraceae bacterium]